jgi:ribosomal protein S27AE
MPEDLTPSSRRCARCGETKPTDQFRLFTSGRHRYCDPCRLAASRQWHQANPDRARENLRRWKAENPEAVRAANLRWKANHPERAYMMRLAGSRVLYAIKTGRLVRPLACEECGTSERKITAAHRDYSRPLDVRWLCHACHIAWDQQEPKTLPQKDEYSERSPTPIF